MRCVIVSCVFPPELVVSAQTSAELAQALAAHGHDVTVIAPFPSRNGAQGRAARDAGGAVGRGGPEIVRCWSMVATDSRMARRFLENLTFGVSSAWRVLQGPRPDVIYANTWPIFAAAMLWAAAALRRVPLVLSVQDIYPDSLISQGRISRGGLPARIMRAIDDFVVSRCRGVVLITTAYIDAYVKKRGHEAGRFHLVPNWRSRDSLTVDDGASQRYRASKGLPSGTFVSVCGGNIGRAAGVEGLIAAYERLRDDSRLVLLIAGDGARFEACRRSAESLPPGRVVFERPWPKELTAPVLGAADLLIVPTLGRQSEVSAPSKAISYLLAGRPILAQALPGTYLTALVEDSGAGWVVPPDDPGALAAKVREISALPPEELRRRGAAGREFALRHMTTEACLPKLIGILTEAANG
jgi:glycosyltransferase involved in cell wall biosynthesis